MRSTTLISFLATGLALLSQTPAAYTAPIPSPLISAGEKRCTWAGCRIAEPTTNTTTTPDPASTPQTGDTPTVLGMVDMLISALDAYRNQYTSSGPPSATDFTIPAASADDPTTDGSPAVAAVNTPELAGEAL